MINTRWQFNFGPIARTDAGDTPDTFNLASLPLHVMLDALMAATNRDEFVAWLWHDLFKPAFYWHYDAGRDKFDWEHIPGYGGSVFEPAEHQFADHSITNVPLGLVGTHHAKKPYKDLPHFTILEKDIISEQVDQINLGAASIYVQLAFAIEPALPAALVRAVIAESFVEIVTKDVAAALRTILATKSPSFSRVRFVFETRSGFHFSNPPTNAEIWSQVGQQYDVRPNGDELVMTHIAPVSTATNFSTEVVVDLTGAAPTPEQMPNTLGLAELLIVYQDDRTIVMTVPHPHIYHLDISDLKVKTLALTKSKLQLLDVLTIDKGTDLLAAAFDSQIDIREVPGRLPIPPNTHVNRGNPHLRPIDKIIAYPGVLMSQIVDHGRRCRVCSSSFASDLAAKNDWPGHDFTDAEYLGSGGDICPLCRIYTANSHKSRTPEEKQLGITGDRKALRGSFALILPSSHFDVWDGDCRLIERPPLDVGGRFDLTKPPLQRVTVTQQEYALFNQISRRVIAALWRKIDSSSPIPLPYLGGILLTQREAEQVRKVLPVLRDLLAPVTLLAYPFEVSVKPGVEIALDVVLADFKQHHTKHTYLKSRVNVFPIDPESRLFVLADSKLQIEINRDWFDACDRLATFTSGMSASQRNEWMRRVASGNDIVTSYFESLQTSLLRNRSTAPAADRTALSMTDDVWVKLFGDDPNQRWVAYEQMSKEIQAILERYPMLLQLFSVMTQPKEREDDSRDTIRTSEEANESGVGRGPGRGQRTASARRPRTRRQTGR